MHDNTVAVNNRSFQDNRLFQSYSFAYCNIGTDADIWSNLLEIKKELKILKYCSTSSIMFEDKSVSWYGYKTTYNGSWMNGSCRM